jgi:hypothetical protein
MDTEKGSPDDLFTRLEFNQKNVREVPGPYLPAQVGPPPPSPLCDGVAPPNC